MFIYFNIYTKNDYINRNKKMNIILCLSFPYDYQHNAAVAGVIDFID